ncbi:MAG: isoprenylcysteine carboxylmethyltransferase family protein [Pirellulales bacterium]|nr:isoprenylcysteine carboxylmethyltransferase family protein [Pirellulales bacterium]
MSTPGETATKPSRWNDFVSALLQRRVQITGLLFIVLIAEDLVERVVPHDLTDFHDGKVLAGIGFVLAGVFLRSWAAGTLRKRTHLATGGPYRFVRHPLYVGSFAMMLGFCLLIDDPKNFWFVLGPILGLYILRVTREERFLAGRYPEEWPPYARAVPRFIPWRLPLNAFQEWDFAQWMHNREYQAFGSALLGLAGIQAWHWMLS